MRTFACLLLTGVAALVTARAVAAPETCTSYLTAQRDKMVAAALACGGGDPATIRSRAEAARAGEKLITFAECSRPVSVAGTEDLFHECVRTHLCAAQSYTCALGRATEHSSVKECGQATDTCKLTDPIPQ